MNESKKNLNQHLESIRASLVNLRSLTLTPRAQQELDKTLVRLGEAMKSSSAGEEQDRLAALYRVSKVLGTSLKLDEVLDKVMDAVIGLTEAERGFLMLAEGRGEELQVRVGRNMEQETLEREEMNVSRTVIRTVLDSGKGVVTTNAQEDPRFAHQESVVSFSLLSILCSPLQARGKTIGVIYVDSRAQAGLFTQGDLEMLNAFAAQAAAAIQNALQYTQIDQKLADRVAELEGLARFSRTLNTHETLEAVLESIRTWALNGTSAEEVWIAALDEENGRQTIRVACGPGKGQTIPKDHPQLRPVLASNTPHIFEIQTGTPARLAVPILGSDSIMAVLVAERPSGFPPDDLSFLVRLTNQASVAVDKLKLYNQVRNAGSETAAFVSTVAHELRIPMTSIMGYTDLLKQGAIGPVNENQLNFLSVIRENVGRMSKLVSDLSDLSKADGGRLHLEPSDLAIREMAERVVEAAREETAAKKQTVDVQVAADLPNAYADPSRVEQILAYLIDNASRYSPVGGEIEVRARADGQVIHTAVKDNGIGISAEDQAQLFTQFFRSEQMEVREEKGWGLSLCVVKELVTLMGGKVGFESKPGAGSTFWFRLPAAG